MISVILCHCEIDGCSEILIQCMGGDQLGKLVHELTSLLLSNEGYIWCVPSS